MDTESRIGFIGAGNMAAALCHGIIRAGIAAPGEIVAADPNPEQRQRFGADTGAKTAADNASACGADVVILAVKPQIMPNVLGEIGPLLTPKHLVVSVAAGVPTAAIEAAAPCPVRVVRAMPNTPMLIGQGAAGLCAGAHATRADLDRAKKMFEASATVIEVPEALMHAVTALSGSGPAYVFLLAEMMMKAGVEMGLSQNDALLLSQRTVLGAAHMLADTGESAEELRRKVTSPNGTTHAAITSMEKSGVPEGIVAAIQAACRRSEELGRSEA